MSRIDVFLDLAAKQGGSDLHLVSGEAPRIRIHGRLESVRFRELSPEDVRALIEEMLTPVARERLGQGLSVDFAYVAQGIGRFRVNVSRHRSGIAAVLRVIPAAVQTYESLGLPEAIRQVLAVPKGLVVVTGPTGSGKSTTQAAIVDLINRSRPGHVITIEDPIEFVHQHQRCVFTQREIGTHAPSFSEALRAALREDPDVIMVGEMRDLETIALALTAAETGVLVLGTLHTRGAVRVVDRIINVFPARRQDQVRTMLADSLRLVISQQLARKTDMSGRVVAAEVLVNTHAVSAMIRRGDAHKLTSAIQAGARHGMQALDAVLTDLVRKNVITGAEAHEHALDRTTFERHLLEEAA